MMNERIKELKQQAESCVRQEHGYAENTLLPQEWVDAKFAELIVGECLAIAKNREDELESAGLIEESNAVGNVSYRISRQFGVKR